MKTLLHRNRIAPLKMISTHCVPQIGRSRAISAMSSISFSWLKNRAVGNRWAGVAIAPFPEILDKIVCKICSIKWPSITACPLRFWPNWSQNLFSHLPPALQDHHYPIIHWYSCHSVQKDWHKNWPEIIFNDLLFSISFSHYDGKA